MVKYREWHATGAGSTNLRYPFFCVCVVVVVMLSSTSSSSDCALVLHCYALWVVKKSRATSSTNQK